MRPPRNPGFDRSSQTFADTQEILGGKSPKPTPTSSGADGSPSSVPPGHKLSGMSIDVGDNQGVSVTHTSKPAAPKKGEHEFDSRKSSTNVFSTPQEAHAHIGKLLGCPDCGPASTPQTFHSSASHSSKSGGLN